MGRPPKPKTELAQRLIALRGKETRVDFCQRLGVKVETYTNYERGNRAPDAGVIEKIRKTTGVNIHWLLTGEGEMLKVPPQQTDAATPSELRTISKLGEDLAKSSKALIEYLQRRSPFEVERDKRQASKLAEEILDSLMEGGLYVRPINSAEEIETLDPDLFEKLHILCAEEHKKHGITLSAPKLTSLTVELFNNISRRVATMNDKAAVEAMIPVAIKELGERLEEAKVEPGTGKHSA